MSNVDLSINFSELDSLLNPKEHIGITGFIIKMDDYVNKYETEALNSMTKKLTCEESLSNFYIKVCQNIKKPDLLGKTVQVTPKQFKRVYEIAKDIAEILNITLPAIFVYEDLYYRADVEGFDIPWVEMTAKLIQDFTDDELKFVLGKLFASIQCKQHKYEAISKALNEVTNYVDMIPVMNIANAFHILDGYKLNLMPTINSWRRCACYSTDACGLLLCGSFKVAVNAILKQILNNCDLVSEVNIKEYIEKTNEIKNMSGKMVQYSKIDEAIPYGPYRVLELLRYTSSERCSKTLVELSRRKL